MPGVDRQVWKTGFEIELLAPPGKSRLDLARALADRQGGTLRRIFCHQSEPSKVPGMPVFENLTLGYEVYDGEGSLVATCVDDLTIRDDLDRRTKSLAGWYRVLSDDSRIIRLAFQQCDPDAGQREVLAPLAELFGTSVAREESDIYQVKDDFGTSIAMASALPGERERPCEIVTPPLEDDRETVLRDLLETAHDLGFSVPKEAAVHIHFDARRLRKTKPFLRLLEVLQRHGEALKKLVGTNPDCVRLGKLPAELLSVAGEAGFGNLGWKLACRKLQLVELSKYSDFNVLNVIHDIPGKPTFEVRILPGSMDATEIARWATLFEAILWHCVETAKTVPRAGESLADLVSALPLDDAAKQHWRELL